METTNYEFLCEDLKYLGFAKSLARSLKEKMIEPVPAFELYYSGWIDYEPIDAILHFSKSRPDGFFFFTGYQLSLHARIHHFKIFKGKGPTLKEGYNLLCGRAVHKQLIGKNGQRYLAWMQLDLDSKEGENFKVNTYFESHGYDLSASLDAFSIEAPSSNWNRAMLLRSLEKGNLQSALLYHKDGVRKVLIEANPKDKTIRILEDILPEETPLKWGLSTETPKEKKEELENLPDKNKRRKKNKAV
jgi:hypothetical protein